MPNKKSFLIDDESNSARKYLIELGFQPQTDSNDIYSIRLYDDKRNFVVISVNLRDLISEAIYDDKEYNKLNAYGKKDKRVTVNLSSCEKGSLIHNIDKFITMILEDIES